MRAIVLSSGARVTRTFSTASALIEPANTRSPGSLMRGTDSPVTGLSSTPEVPSITSPSAGTRSPGRTRTALPTARLSAGTSRTRVPTTRRAVFGTSAPSARMPARARPAATPSSTSPMAKRKTTIAASAAAPIASAPAAATVISISIVKVWPSRAAANARRATGTRPISVATTPPAGPGRTSCAMPAAASSAPVARTKWPLVVAVPGTLGSRCAADLLPNNARDGSSTFALFRVGPARVVRGSMS